MFDLKINEAKSNFFDRPTVEKLDRDARRGLAKFGSYVRRTARTSLRKARQKKLAELTHEERQRYRIRQEYARRDGLAPPRRPLAHSKPGEPPRMIEGSIRRFLFFSYDAENRSVVIGPTLINSQTGAPRTLEEGGTVITRRGSFRILPRPYMKPAFEANINKLPRLLAGGN